jgi:hypothetical protein
MTCTRRDFLAACSIGVFGEALAATADEKSVQLNLTRQVGVTTSSFARHLTVKPRAGEFTLLELPRIMRNELDMRVIDLNTSSLASFEAGYLDRCREAAEKAGCVFTNLKMNQRGLNMDSRRQDERTKSLTEYKRTIDAGARLGVRWVRPLPNKERPDLAIHAASYRELADYAAPRKVQLLVENYGWMESDPQSVPQVIKAVGRNIAACPDTGNWSNNQVRYDGLARAFPLAVTCDFKARELGPKGEHVLYDLERCFRIGWDAGFRGPWCLEHAHADRKALFRELALLRDMLRQWMAKRK